MELARQHPELAALARQHGRMLEVAILAGNQQRAEEVVHRAFATLNEKFELTASTRLDVFLADRLVTLLEAADIYCVGDLCAETRESLARISQIRATTISVIENKLQRYGWQLRRTESD